jgi:hypothetical protein
VGEAGRSFLGEWALIQMCILPAGPTQPRKRVLRGVGRTTCAYQNCTIFAPSGAMLQPVCPWQQLHAVSNTNRTLKRQPGR